MFLFGNMYMQNLKGVDLNLVIHVQNIFKICKSMPIYVICLLSYTVSVLSFNQCLLAFPGKTFFVQKLMQ